MTDEELTDLIAEAISDSLDMDWNSSDGARAVVAMLWREGLLPPTPDPYEVKAREVLAKCGYDTANSDLIELIAAALREASETKP